MIREQGLKVANGVLHFLGLLVNLAMAVLAVVEAFG
jgi:hypothetical protein